MVVEESALVLPEFSRFISFRKSPTVIGVKRSPLLLASGSGCLSLVPTSLESVTVWPVLSDFNLPLSAIAYFEETTSSLFVKEDATFLGNLESLRESPLESAFN
ncbi:Uncharacterised protein [Chlamydia trachomatis]|nr:Uncharacterised protein [Chlamydia trachomatis]